MAEIDPDKVYQRGKLGYGFTEQEVDVLTLVEWWHAGHLVSKGDEKLNIGTHRPPPVETLSNAAGFIEWNDQYDAAVAHLQERDFLREQYIGRRKIPYGLTMDSRKAITDLLKDQEGMYAYWANQEHGTLGAAPLYGDRDLTQHRTAVLVGVESTKALGGLQRLNVEDVHIYPGRDHPNITNTGPMPDALIKIKDRKTHKLYTLAVEGMGPGSGSQTAGAKMRRRSSEADAWVWMAQNRETLVDALQFAPPYAVGRGWDEVSASSWSNKRINQRERKSGDLWWTTMSMMDMSPREFAKLLRRHTSLF